MHAKTYNDRNSIPQEKHRHGMVIKIISVGCVCVCGGGGVGGGGGLKSILRGHNPRPIHKTIVQSALRVPNSSVRHLREHKKQANTELKQR